MISYQTSDFNPNFDIIQQSTKTRDIRVRDLFCVQTTRGYHFGIVARTDADPIFDFPVDSPDYKPHRKLVYFYRGAFESPDDYVHLDRSLNNIDYRPTFVYDDMWHSGYFFTVLRPDTHAELIETHISGSLLTRFGENSNEPVPLDSVIHTNRSMTLMWGGICRLLALKPGQQSIHEEQDPSFRSNGLFDRYVFDRLDYLKTWTPFPFNRPGTEPGERRDFEIKKHGHVEQEPEPGDMFVMESTDGFHFGAVLEKEIGHLARGWVLIRLFKGVFDTPDVEQVDTSVENTLFRPFTVNPGFCWWMGHFQPIKHNHHIDLPHKTAYRSGAEIVDKYDKAVPIETPVIADFRPITIQAIGWIIQDQAKWANTHWPYPELNFRYPPDSGV